MSKTEDDWDELLRAVALLAGEVEGQSEGRCTPASATTARQVIALIQPLCQRPTTYTDGEGGIIFIWRGGREESNPVFLLMDNQTLHAFNQKGSQIHEQLENVPFDGVTLDPRVLTFLPKRESTGAP